MRVRMKRLRKTLNKEPGVNTDELKKESSRSGRFLFACLFRSATVQSKNKTLISFCGLYPAFFCLYNSHR